jgi:hypothetical protein
MGLQLFGTIFPLLGAPVPASENYSESAKNINQGISRTDAAMELLGLRPRSHLRSPAASPDESSSAPILQIVDATNRLVAPAGKILWGKSLGRIILSSDAHPLKLVLDPEQGLFSGLIVLGIAKASSTSGRVQMDLDRLVLRTGRTESIQGLGLDEQGALGVEAHVLSGKLSATGGALATGFISGLAAGSQSQVTGAFGYSQTEITPRNAILQGLSQAASDQSKRLIEDATRERPILILEPGAHVGIYLQQEVRL